LGGGGAARGDSGRVDCELWQFRPTSAEDSIFVEFQTLIRKEVNSAPTTTAEHGSKILYPIMSL
jgi:hypothetical protein